MIHSTAIATRILKHQREHQHLAVDVAKCACRGVKLGCERCAKPGGKPEAAAVGTSRPQAYGELRGRRVEVLGESEGRTFWRTSDRTCTGWTDSGELLS